MTEEDILFGSDAAARSKILDHLQDRAGGMKVLLTYILDHIYDLENP